jgi:ribosomal protein L37E
VSQRGRVAFLGDLIVDDRRAGNHAFNERGGRCEKCGITWSAYWDADSPRHRGSGRKPEPRERMVIED